VGFSSQRVSTIVVLILAVLAVPSKAVANGVHALKVDKAKAAFTLNIAKFVTWPEQIVRVRPEIVRLCLYQSSTLLEAFSIIEGKHVGSREVSAVKVIDSVSQGSGCDVLFIPSMTLRAFADEVAMANSLPVLTIADATNEDQLGVARYGVVVSLVRKQSSMGLEVNITEAENKQLKLSSELLKLAHIIDGGRQ
jgi:hypothetical protein